MLACKRGVAASHRAHAPRARAGLACTRRAGRAASPAGSPPPAASPSGPTARTCRGTSSCSAGRAATPAASAAPARAPPRARTPSRGAGCPARSSRRPPRTARGFCAAYAAPPANSSARASEMLAARTG
eukprot:1934622-Prymnesium_polylepis.1